MKIWQCYSQPVQNIRYLPLLNRRSTEYETCGLKCHFRMKHNLNYVLEFSSRIVNAGIILTFNILAFNYPNSFWYASKLYHTVNSYGQLLMVCVLSAVFTNAIYILNVIINWRSRSTSSLAILFQYMLSVVLMNRVSSFTSFWDPRGFYQTTLRFAMSYFILSVIFVLVAKRIQRPNSE